MLWAVTALVPVVLAVAVGAWGFRKRAYDRWLPSYLAGSRSRRPPRPGEPVHVLICIADHYEPKGGGAAPDVARARVDRWVQDYPRNLGGFRDSDGRPPRHTFFYPYDEYDAEHLDAITGLCRAGFGEVELHLHHDGDTSDTLRATLQKAVDVYSNRHGVLPRDRRTGRTVYGFVHGNWALDNSRPDGRWCGVNNELDVLRETGCYADFTLPSAPSPTQTRKINSLYYAVDDPARPKSHDRGVDLGASAPPDDALLIVQGPLLLDWRNRRWGLVPRTENSCIQASQPPSLARLDLWLRARVQAPGRPDWFFVKLHAHGAPESMQNALLGEPMMRFHRGLAERAESDPNFHYHYVTAREMYNLAKAAEAGWTGSVADARDYLLVWEDRREGAAAPRESPQG